MENVKRETSRSTTASDRRQSGLFSKAYSSVSSRGQRSSSLLGRTNSTHDTSPSRAAGSSSSIQNGPKASVNSGSTDLLGFTGVFPVPEDGCEPLEKPGLTDEQQSKYKMVLEFFQNKENQTFPTSLQGMTSGGKTEPASDWEKLRLLSRESMLRYLRATKWDVKQAQKRIIETIAWRREFGVDTLDADEMAKEAHSGKETVLGYDNNARPLHYMHPHRNDTKESPRQMQYAVWILERCIDLMPPGVEQLALLINFDHRSRNPTSIANAKLMLYILQNHYVERLGIALCINVPWVFKIFWNAIQPFIDPVTKSKCRFDEAVKTAVPLSQLSADFGGNLDPKYNHDAYFPELVKVCQERRRDMERRFAEQCKSEIGASEWIIRGGDDPTSPFNAQAASPAATGQVASVADKDAAEDGEMQRRRAESATTSTDKSSIMTTNPAATGAAVAGATASGSATKTKTPEMKNAAALERFKTPSDSINREPLERYFSTTSIAAGAENEAEASLDGATAAENAHDTSSAARKDSPASSQRNSSFATGWNQFEGGVTRGFKGMESKFHKSKMFKDINAAFHPDSRRSSREHKRASIVEKKDHASVPAKQEAIGATSASTSAPESNVADSDIPQLPSAAEAVALAGAAGCTTAATTIGAIAAEQAGHQMQRATSQASASISGMLSSPTTEGDEILGGKSRDLSSDDKVANGLVAVALPQHDEAARNDGAHQDGAHVTPAQTSSMPPRKVTMLFFAAAKDAVGGKGKHELVLPSDTPDAGLPLIELAARLLSRPPPGANVVALKRVLERSKWSVDEEMIDDDQVGSTIIHGGEDVAIIPPVSGG